MPQTLQIPKGSSELEWCWALSFSRNKTLVLFTTESIVQRIINIIKLISILMHALMDDIIEALNSLSKVNLDIADVLRMEKYILWQQMNKVRLLNFEVL